MPGNAIPRFGAAQGVVAHSITWGGASRAGAIAGVDWQAQSVLQDRDELCSSEVETQGGRRNNREPAASVWETKRVQPGNLPQLTLLGDCMEKEGLVLEINLEA